ncbi:MAG: long-chain fatty acid--CoA ligase [Candidatus Eremiobacteraeota bacterium]|nr:long-chain fatty acid--CoA ligase [Candidatus Eremiobacteraeota bacterium]
MQTIAARRETLPQLILRCLEKQRDAALVERTGGKWTPLSSEALLKRVNDLACAIRDCGLGAGDRVGLISPNRIDWIVADFATLFAGCVVVPIFPTQAVDQVGFILNDSQAKLLFIDKQSSVDRLKPLASRLPRTIVFDGEGENSLRNFEERGASVRALHPEQPACFQESQNAGDVAVLIYTSGTTGQPKGVMLTHYNLASNANAVFDYGFEPERDNIALSVLPFSHIYEHCFIYGYLMNGVTLYIARSTDELVEDLKEVRPMVMTSVPRIFELMIAGIVGKAKHAGGLRAKLVPWALAAGREYMTCKVAGKRPGIMRSLKYAVAKKLVLSKIRPLMGLDRLSYFCSGSAPLHDDTAMTLLGIGIEILQGYGVTECSPVITCNRQEDNRYGTVGRPIPGVEVKIADDGEVLARGPNVMKGYYHDDGATASALVDGWYHTGDIGALDRDGYLIITDRKKELFKTSGGKFISPARIETAIKRSVYINQVMVVGDGRPHPAALVSPNWPLLAAELNLPRDGDSVKLADRKDVWDFLTAEVRRNTADLARFEQVRRVVVLPHELSVENGELSPTLKVKRRVVETHFGHLIDRVYALDLNAANRA